ncbi:hypothetical protein [Photobacterium halotolerans]|uniref:hypothetical protein n=1 Tax=Photobacterium halotolerans TaxID=265726 RepID=UPI0004184C8D|nr:hypothetical protein [Photobacterium halotolerans]
MGGGGGGVKVKDSEAEKEMARIAADKWRQYNQTFVPLENQWMKEIEKMRTSDQYSRAAGIGNVSVNAAYGQAMDQLVSQGGNASKLNAGINAMASSQHSDRVNTQSRMQQSQTARYFQGLSAINATGAGKEAEAISSMYDGAQVANKYNQQSAMNEYQDKMANQQLIGMGVGAATRWGIN